MHNISLFLHTFLNYIELGNISWRNQYNNGIRDACSTADIFNGWRILSFAETYCALEFLSHSCYAPLRRPYENWPKWPVNRSQYVPLQICLYQHFCLNDCISETKQGFVNALVAKWHPRTRLSPTLSSKWPRPTLSTSFGLFLEWKPFFGVFQLGQIHSLKNGTVNVWTLDPDW